MVTGSYGIELYMASIVEDWYGLKVKEVAYLIIIPAIGSLDRPVSWSAGIPTGPMSAAGTPRCRSFSAPRRWSLLPDSKGTLWLTIALFTLAMIGVKAYLPAFWALPSLFLTESAAAASIGLINSFGNLGGWVGPSVLGVVKQATGSYRYGLWFLSCSVILSALIIASLGIGGKARPTPVNEAFVEPV